MQRLAYVEAAVGHVQAERTPCAICGAPVVTSDAHRDFHPEANALVERFVQQAQTTGCVETG